VKPGGNNYFLLVVDDYSRYMWLEVLKAKSDTFQWFCKIKAATEAAGNCKLECSAQIVEGNSGSSVRRTGSSTTRRRRTRLSRTASLSEEIRPLLRWQGVF
jgi:hypothetical protein